MPIRLELKDLDIIPDMLPEEATEARPKAEVVRGDQAGRRTVRGNQAVRQSG